MPGLTSSPLLLIWMFPSVCACCMDSRYCLCMDLCRKYSHTNEHASVFSLHFLFPFLSFPSSVKLYFLLLLHFPPWNLCFIFFFIKTMNPPFISFVCFVAILCISLLLKMMPLIKRMVRSSRSSIHHDLFLFLLFVSLLVFLILSPFQLCVNEVCGHSAPCCQW